MSQRMNVERSKLGRRIAGAFEHTAALDEGFRIRRQYVWMGSLVFLLMSLTLFMTWPLPLQMDQSVIGGVGDNFAFVWLIGWFQRSLFELHQLPLTVPILNYPEGYHLAYTDASPLMILMALPFSLVGGSVLGYNLSMFVSFVLSGLGVYLWVRWLTHNQWAGILAGVLFAFVPYRMSHLYGHLNLMGTQWFPFYFLGLSTLLSVHTGSWRRACLPAVFLGFIAFTSLYYLYMSLIITIVFIVAHLVLGDIGRLRQLHYWKQLGTLAILGIPLVGFAVAPSLQVTGRESLSHSFEAVRIWSASPTDYILPSPRHFLWGDWIDQHFDRRLWVATTLYVGVVPFVFGVLALFDGSKVLRDRATPGTLICTSIAAFILSMGTDLHWLGQSVTVSVPEFIQRWHPYPETFIPMPGYFLFKYLPYYATMRDWTRYGIFVALFMSVLAGVGMARVFRQITYRLVAPCAVMLLCIVLFDFYTGVQPLSPVTPRAVDLWLREQMEQGAVAQFPFWQAKHPQYSYYTLIHRKPFVADPFGTFNTAQFQRIEPVLRAFPDQPSVSLLRDLGVRWVVVDSTRYEDFAQIQAALALLGLEPGLAANGQHVYILK